MKSHIKGYRALDESLLIIRLPLTNSKCQVCGSNSPQVRHHITDANGIIYVWSVCRTCNNTIGQLLVDAEPVFTIYGFHDKTSSYCPACGKPRTSGGKLKKHHYIEGKSVFVLRVCHACNLRLPGIGIENNKQILEKLQRGAYVPPQRSEKWWDRKLASLSG